MIMIADYKLGDLLGMGAFGETYVAVKENEEFALKLIKEDALIKGFDINRFKRECRALEKVRHENIVKIIEYGQTQIGNNIRYFLVMEYLSGQDLEKFFQTNFFNIEENAIKNILIQVLWGLKAIHNENILHRDIKPQNIFITIDGKIKLLDFGLVKMIDYTSLTMTGDSPKGTPLYIPPEAIRGEKLDYRSDLYSLGVMVYYILTKGHYPFETTNILQLIDMVKNKHPIPLKRYNKNISNEFENLVLMLLSKQPYERNISHDELVNKIIKTPIFQESIIFSAKRYSNSQKNVWYRLLHTEKKIIIDFLKKGRNINGVEYVANYLPRAKNTLSEFQEKKIKYFFDPATNRLAYSTFSQTKGLLELPYCWDNFDRLTPEKLSDINSIKKYVSQVIDWQEQWGTDFFVSPFHYHHNLNDKWFETDMKLLHESIDYVRKKYENKKIFSGICFDIEEYTTEKNRIALLNEFSLCNPDGFIFYGDEIRENITNPARLYAYLDIVRLFSNLGKKIIVARLGTLGLGILAAGADITTTGIASLTGFSEKSLLQERATGYDMKPKYYIPQLMLTLPVKLAEDIITNDDSLRCNCDFCTNNNNIEAIAKIHYLETKQKEIDEFNLIDDKDKITWFIDRVNLALQNCKKVQNKLKEFNPSNFSHLNTWLKVFDSFNNGKTHEI